MAGLSGLAAGLAQGYASGLKLKSDMQDAEERRKLTAAQTEIATGQAAQLKSQQEYEKERKDYMSSFMNPTTGETAPAGDGAPQAGIKAPGTLFDQTPNLNDMGTLQRLNNGLMAIDAKHGKIGAKDLLEGAQRYKRMQEEGVFDAWKQVMAGDTEGALKTFNSTGTARLPEGTRFEAKDEELIPGSGIKSKNYYAISPDGRTISYRDMMRGTVAPAELMKIDAQTGYQVADLALKKQAEENAAKHRTEIFELTNKKYDRLIGEQKAQTDIALRRLGLAEDDARYQKTQQAFGGAFGELTNTLGVNKKFDPAMAGEKEKQEQAAKLLAASGAQSIFEMNYNLGKNSAGLTPQMALEAWKTAASDPSKVQANDRGEHFIKMGGKDYFVPSSMAPRAAPEPSAAPQGRTAGIKTPSGPTVSGRPLYNANQSDLMRLATKPRGVSSAEAAQAQAELDARKGESRMSAF